jgi:hypothetical protein
MDALPDAVRNGMPALETVVGAGARPNEWASRINGVLYLLANARDAGEAAETLGSALTTDAALKKQSDGAGKTNIVSATTSRFVDAVQRGVDYESLVTLADAAKTELSELIT